VLVSQAETVEAMALTNRRIAWREEPPHRFGLLPAACFVHPALDSESIFDPSTTADAISATDVDAGRRPWIAEVAGVSEGQEPGGGAWLAEAWSKEEDGEIWYF
jgi:hypothetical protein